MLELIAVVLFAMCLLGLVSSYFEFHGISVGINVKRKLAKGTGLGGI